MTAPVSGHCILVTSMSTKEVIHLSGYPGIVLNKTALKCSKTKKGVHPSLTLVLTRFEWLRSCLSLSQCHSRV